MRRFWLLALLPACYFDRSGVGGGDPSDGAVIEVPDGSTETIDGAGPTVDAMATEVDAMEVVATCPLGYGITGDPALPHRYRFDDANAAHGTALTDCANDSDGLTYLAVIDGEEENSYLDTISGARSVWLGISDGQTEGTWITVLGGTQSYFSWGGGQPDNFFNEDLAMLLDGGKWNDAGGGNARYVCECDLDLAIDAP